VGRRIGSQLKEAGIHTVLDLARLDPVMVKRRWSVVLAQYEWLTLFSAFTIGKC
jgi:nucleotidyltransferase/DNA polymerase involved in DNA repair